MCRSDDIVNSKIYLNQLKKLTSHPSVKDELINYNYSEEIIVDDNRIITSRGAGTAFEMAFYIIEKLFGKEESEKVQQAIVWTNK